MRGHTKVSFAIVDTSCSLIDTMVLAIKQLRMFANGVSWSYSVYENEKSVLKFKILIIKN